MLREVEQQVNYSMMYGAKDQAKVFGDDEEIGCGEALPEFFIAEFAACAGQPC